MPTINVVSTSNRHLQDIADLLGKSRKVVVITGAGISTNCGIPDFRSENGLYSMIQAQYHAALVNPPWETSNTDDIDVRPKRRKVTDRYYYRVESFNGEIIEDGLSKESCKRILEGDTSKPLDSRTWASEARIESDKADAMEQPAKADAAELSPSDQVMRDGACLFAKESTLTNWHAHAAQSNTHLSSSCALQEDVRPHNPSPPIGLRTPQLPNSPPKSPSKGLEKESHLSNPPCTELLRASRRLKAMAPQSPPPSQHSDQNATQADFQSACRIPTPEVSSIVLTSPSSSAHAKRPAKLTSPTSSNHVSDLPVSSSRGEIDQLPSQVPTPDVPGPLPHQLRRLLQHRSLDRKLSRSDTDDFTCSQSSSRNSLPNMKGKDLFDSMIWQDPFTTSLFYMFVSSLRKKIWEDVKSTTHTHRFIRTLRDGGRLVRNYTQNIDCLEEREELCTNLSLGVGDRARFKPKVQRGNSIMNLDRGVECVLLHGSLTKLRCGVCAKLSDWDEADRHVTTLSGSAPDCPSCLNHSNARQQRGRRGLAVGRLRPDIVLYGEEHPNAQLIAPLVTYDIALGPDVLLILGTSLRVHGLKVMVREFAKAVHAKRGRVVFVNQTKPPDSIWGDVIDYHVEWDCDAWVLDLQSRRQDIWQTQGEVQESPRSHVKPPCKQQQKRTQAMRDHKANGIYTTFAILDNLRDFKDANKMIAARKRHWPRRKRRSVLFESVDPKVFTTRPLVEIPLSRFDASDYAFIPDSKAHCPTTDTSTVQISRKMAAKHIQNLGGTLKAIKTIDEGKAKGSGIKTGRKFQILGAISKDDTVRPLFPSHSSAINLNSFQQTTGPDDWSTEPENPPYNEMHYANIE